VRREKTPFERIAQRNRLFAKFAGPGSHKTSWRNKARIFRVLFGRGYP
jgi:hypothetical protein